MSYLRSCLLFLASSGAALLLAVPPAPPLFAAGPLEASTSSAARAEAVRAIPFSELTEEVRGKLTSVVHHPTLYRRLPLQVIDCDPEMYLFLVRYPEVVVNIWKLMDITRVDVQRTGMYTMRAADGAGTVSNAELVYGTRDLHIIYAEGSYSGPLVKELVTGRCVLVLHSGYAQSGPERTYVSNRLDVFVQLDHPAAELIAKTIHPLIGKTVDQNFLESAAFLGKVSRVAETNGPGLQQLCDRLEDVDPKVRERFAELAASIYHQAALRASNSEQPGSVARLLEHSEQK